jgi:transposase
VIGDKKSGIIIATAFSEGKCADFALYKRSRTGISLLLSLLGDSGYQGLDKYHKNSLTPKKKSKHHPLTEEDKARNKEISRQRIVCEHMIGRLKVFRILCERYRNRRKRFGLRFNLIAAICNLERNE